MKIKTRIGAVVGLLVFLVSSQASAAIIGATGATINSGGAGFGSISDTFNQNGLNASYTPGVTDFDTYVAATTHTFIFSGYEWFSDQGTTSAQVTYDLGSVYTIDKMALWNEEASGIGLLDLFVSTDNVSYVPLLAGLAPTDNPQNTDYAADVFSFASTSFQFIRLDMSRCPQPDNIFSACAIGEVAFNVSAVPVPAAVWLFGTGILGLIGVSKRRKAA